MSLTVLLADYPAYSARKVRKLARQIRYLSGLQTKAAEDIIKDLEDYHLKQAQYEQQCNDDVAKEPGVANNVS